MKNLNIKSIAVIWAVWLQSCIWLRESSLNTKSQIAHIWGQVESTQVEEGFEFKSDCDGTRITSNQDQPNSCSFADIEMIFNHYGDKQYTEAEITQLYNQQHPFAAKTSQHLFKWQNPHIGSIARFIQNNIEWVTTHTTKTPLTAQFLHELCATWWSVMISIHSSLWYPHRITVVWYREENWVWLVQCINPWWIATDATWGVVTYRDFNESLESLTISNQSRIDEIKLLDLNLLRVYTTYDTKFPIYLIQRPAYIVIQPKNESEDSSLR